MGEIEKTFWAGALTLGVFVAVWYYGLATFDPTPFWVGALSAVGAAVAFKLWRD